ncbi:MAG TPA: IclR family transcriptional regulator C-terminal domain-containing protein [Actinocrinis sp.]|nr:IclR family transcriptional regulator C-terminal domain-containing protein [Actinocrinis sp.]
MAANDSVAPLERGLAVLRALCASREDAVRPGDLVRETGLARSTVDRVLSTLTHLDYLRTDARAFSLAPRAMQFGNAYLTACGLPDALESFAVRLTDELDESVSVAVPDRDGVRFVVQIPRRRTMTLAFRVGDLLPAERCAPGALFAPHWSARQRALWSQRLGSRRFTESGASTTFSPLPAVPGSPRPQEIESAFDERVATAATAGWALDDQLIEPGLIAIAVPIRDGTDSRVVAAVSVVSHTSRHSAESLRDHALGRLREAARQMQDELAGSREPATLRRASSPASGSATGSGEDPRGLPAPPPIDEPKRDLGAHYLRSLARGLTVLVALGSRRGGMTLSAVADATGLPRATARRALITLRAEGYADCLDPEGRLFAPLPAVLELGYARLCGRGIEELVRPHLLELSTQVHESASVAVLRGPEISYVARVATSRIMQAAITVGTRLPAYATSMGRVLLAALPEAERGARLAATDLEPLTRFTITDPAALAALLQRVAADGYALVDQELEEGLRSMAAPIRDHRGRVVAAVNVSMHAGRVDAEHARETVLPALARTAARISADLAAMGDRLDLGAA